MRRATAEHLSIPGRCFTKQTGDMFTRWRRTLGFPGFGLALRKRFPSWGVRKRRHLSAEWQLLGRDLPQGVIKRIRTARLARKLGVSRFCFADEGQNHEQTGYDVSCDGMLSQSAPHHRSSCSAASARRSKSDAGSSPEINRFATNQAGVTRTPYGAPTIRTLCCCQGAAVRESNVQSFNVDAEIACVSVDNGRVSKVLASTKRAANRSFWNCGKWSRCSWRTHSAAAQGAPRIGKTRRPI